MNEEKIEQARAMMDNPKLKIKSIIKTFGVSKATLYKFVPMGKSATGKKIIVLLFKLRKLMTTLGKKLSILTTYR